VREEALSTECGGQKVGDVIVALQPERHYNFHLDTSMERGKGEGERGGSRRFT